MNAARCMHHTLSRARVKRAAWRLVGKFRLPQCNQTWGSATRFLMPSVSTAFFREVSCWTRREEVETAPLLRFRLTKQDVIGSDMFHLLPLLQGLSEKKKPRLFHYTFSLGDIQGSQSIAKPLLEFLNWHPAGEQPVNNVSWLRGFSLIVFFEIPSAFCLWEYHKVIWVKQSAALCKATRRNN